MTKIEHTRTHNIPASNELMAGHKQVLVTDAKLVLVECEYKDATFFQFLNHPLRIYSSSEGPLKGIGKYYKPILISETEKIEVGDSVLFPQTKDNKDKPNVIGVVKEIKGTEAVITVNGFDVPVPLSYCKKILALPEHLSPQQLQQIVNGKLKDGDKVLVECVTDYNLLEPSDFNPNTGKCFIKLNPHITIYPVEEKMYAREEVKEIVRLAWIEAAYTRLGGLTPSEDSRKWFEQNVK